jgi:hypothetical protein
MWQYIMKVSITYPIYRCFSLELNPHWKSFGNCMKTLNKATLFGLIFGLFACSTPVSQFGVYKQSDGTIGVHAPKDAKENEAKEVALEECKKLGKKTVTLLESRKTVNDRFPITYIYLCR